MAYHSSVGCDLGGDQPTGYATPSTCFHTPEITITPSEHVWTIMEDEGSLFASPGFHIVNRIGYVITENPAQSDVMDAIWHDATDEDSMGFDVNDDDDDDEGPRITAG